MRNNKTYWWSVFVVFFVNAINFNPAFAHSEAEGWSHHMGGGGVWGWGTMALFWLIGLLLVILLLVTLIEKIQD